MRVAITYARLMQATEILDVESEEEAQALAATRVAEIEAGTDDLDWASLAGMGCEAVELKDMEDDDD